MKWNFFSRHWPYVRRIHRSPVNPPHKGQWRGALVFSLIYALTNDCVNNRDAGDLRRHCAHNDVAVMARGDVRGWYGNTKHLTPLLNTLTIVSSVTNVLRDVDLYVQYRSNFNTVGKGNIYVLRFGVAYIRGLAISLSLPQPDELCQYKSSKEAIFMLLPV